MIRKIVYHTPSGENRTLKDVWNKPSFIKSTRTSRRIWNEINQNVENGYPWTVWIRILYLTVFSMIMYWFCSKKYEGMFSFKRCHGDEKIPKKFLYH